MAEMQEINSKLPTGLQFRDIALPLAKLKSAKMIG
jgi:hypothetical protein